MKKARIIFETDVSVPVSNFAVSTAFEFREIVTK